MDYQDWINNLREGHPLWEPMFGQTHRDYIDLGEFKPIPCNDGGHIYEFAGTFVTLRVSMPPRKEEMLELIKLTELPPTPNTPATFDIGEHACCILNDKFSVSFKATSEAHYVCKWREGSNYPDPEVDGLRNEDMRKIIATEGVCFGLGHAKIWATLLPSSFKTPSPSRLLSFLRSRCRATAPGFSAIAFVSRTVSESMKILHLPKAYLWKCITWLLSRLQGALMS